MDRRMQDFIDTHQVGFRWLVQPFIVIRFVVYGAIAFLFSWPLSGFKEAIAASIGTFAGICISFICYRKRVRVWTLILLAIGTACLGYILCVKLLIETSFVSAFLGPLQAREFADMCMFFMLACGISICLHILKLTHDFFVILEALCVTFVLAQMVAAHRYGAINRPFEIADPFLESGSDPTKAFLMLGLIAVVTIFLLCIKEFRMKKIILHTSILGLILLILMSIPSLFHVWFGQKEDSLGLRSSSGLHDNQPTDVREGLEFTDNFKEANRSFPVGIVVFHDDYSPPGGMYYFRQSAFSRYDSHRLALAERFDTDIKHAFSGLFRSPLQSLSRHARVHVKTTNASLVDHRGSFALIDPVRFMHYSNPFPGRFRTIYQVESSAAQFDLSSLVEKMVGSSHWDKATWLHYTQSPNDPAYSALATKIQKQGIQNLDDVAPIEKKKQGQVASFGRYPVKTVVAIQSWLSTEGVYSLQSDHAHAKDPTADFLFGDKKGHCVHFAHAAVYLMRSLGIPSRIGTGYAVEEAARRGGSALLIMSNTSHAWPEVYVQDVGWVIADVSPQRALSDPPALPDPELQQLLGDMVRSLPPVSTRMSNPSIQTGHVLFSIVHYSLYVFLIGCFLLVFIFFMIKLWRLWISRFLYDSPTILYRSAVDYLSEVDIRRDKGETQEAFAKRIKVDIPSFRALTEEHIRFVFGKHIECGKNTASLRHLKDEISRTSPLWRRMLGRLNPISWLMSR